MDARTVLTNKSFCPMPWTGIMYNHNGEVKNCVRSAGLIGNLQQKSIDQILVDNKNQSTQTKILSGQPGEDCYPCHDLERNKSGFNIISDRIFYIKELKSVPLSTYNSAGSHDLKTVDMRWTNLCNFSCVYCGPEFSSVWAEELKIKQSSPTNEQVENFKSYVFDRAAGLKHVYLAGGEPLLMKQNQELLEMLLKCNPDVNLRINTNLSRVGTKVFDLVCQFKNVHWTVSIESIEQEFEYIRHGGNWQDFLDNLKIIQPLGHKISFNMLHFLLNYKSIFDCVDYLIALGFHHNSFVIGALLNPEYLNIRHLPDHVLNSVKSVLEDKINKHPGFLLEDSYKNLRAYLDQPFEKNLLNSFQMISRMDQRRKLDSTKIFTELYKFKQGNYHGKTI
jgi:sulfatase maturation enzyme AslB (radical SAM superfamily)